MSLLGIAAEACLTIPCEENAFPESGFTIQNEGLTLEEN
jgi:hypothetical protein